MTAPNQEMTAPVEECRPFLESRWREEPPETLRERMAAEGYLFFRALVDPAALRGVRHDILAVCARAGWLAPGTDPDEGIAAPGTKYVAGEPEFMRVYDEIQRLESFHALAHTPAIVAVIRLLVQDEVLVHPRNIARVIFPENVAHTTPAHQDVIHIKGTPETYTCWLPLGDCPSVLGGLAVMPGSHKTGIYAHVPAMGAGGRGVETEALPFRWVTSPFRAGDALLFHSHVIHKGLENRTRDRIRVSVDYRYQAASQPVARASLEPHHGRTTWQEIYAGWTSDQYQYYWRTLPLRIE